MTVRGQGCLLAVHCSFLVRDASALRLRHFSRDVFGAGRLRQRDEKSHSASAHFLINALCKCTFALTQNCSGIGFLH